MKIILNFAALIICAVSLASSSYADIVWSEDFSSYSAGDSVDGLATAVGGGTLNSLNSVAVDADGHLVLDANGGTERLYISSNADALCGCFGFDLAITGAPLDGVNDQTFVQLLEGQTFSTNNTNNGNPGPSPNFNLSVRTQNGVSTDHTNLTSIKMFFNVSGSDFMYQAPNGNAVTLASGSRQYWVGSSLIGTGSGSGNGSSAPAAVNTIAFATFNGQEGQQFHFDNMFLDRTIHVPEPGSLAFLAGFVALGFVRRRK